MALACTWVAFASLSSPVVADEKPTLAAKALAHAIEVQDVCQSIGRESDYGLELLQRQVSRRAASTGWTKSISGIALPPAVAPELLDTISDLEAEVHTGDQRTAGFILMIKDLQDGVENAIDKVEKVSVSQRKILADTTGRPLSVDSAMKADTATKHIEMETQLAQLAGDAHLRANRIAEKVKDVQREFQDLSADLNQMHIGDVLFGDLLATATNNSASFELTVPTADKLLVDAMQEVIKSGDNVRAKEDSWREDQSGEEKQVATIAATMKSTSENMKEILGNHAQRAIGISQALDDATRTLKAQDQKHASRMIHANSIEADSQKLSVDVQNKFAGAAREEVIVGNQERATAELHLEKATPTAALQEKRSAPVLASPEAGDVAAKVVSAPWVVADDREKAIPTAVLQAKHSAPVLASPEAVDVAAKVVSAPWVEAEDREKATPTAALQEKHSAPVLASPEAVDVAAKVVSAPWIEAEDQEKTTPTAALQEKHSALLASPEAVDVAAKVVSAPWVEAAHLMGSAGAAGSVAAVQMKPATTSKFEFAKAQDLADSAAQEALEAPAQTPQQEAESAAASAAVEKAQKRVKMQLEHHNDVYPSVVESEEEDTTPEGVAKLWMDSIIQGQQGKIAQVQKRPALSPTDPFLEQQHRASVAADLAREAAAQTQYEENEIKAAAAAVEEARNRVTQILVNRADTTAKPPQDYSITTPEEVAEKWMDSIMQSGEFAVAEVE